MGIFPKPFLDRMEPAVDEFIERVVEKRVARESQAGLEEFVVENDTGAEAGEVR